MLPFQHPQQDTLYPLALIPIRPSPQLLETIYPLCDSVDLPILDIFHINGIM